MNKQHRNFWEALADQYEEWSYKGPVAGWSVDAAEYTCEELDTGRWGWGNYVRSYPSDHLVAVWRYLSESYNTSCPCGWPEDDNYREAQADFCWYMAEAIRDYIERGVLPWEGE